VGDRVAERFEDKIKDLRQGKSVGRGTRKKIKDSGRGRVDLFGSYLEGTFAKGDFCGKRNTSR